MKERLRCGDRVNGAAWPVVPQAVQAAMGRPPQLVEAELERLQRNLAKVPWQCLARPEVVLNEALHNRHTACSLVVHLLADICRVPDEWQRPCWQP